MPLLLPFSVFFHIILSVGHAVPEEVWWPLLILVMKVMSCRFSCSVRDFVYHQHGIYSMYSEENPQYFGLPVPCFYPRERVMLLLSSEAPFKPGGPLLWKFTSENLSQGLILCRPSLAYKGSGYTIFRTEPSLRAFKKTFRRLHQKPEFFFLKRRNVGST